jgi:hypothetical protein
VHAAKKGEAPVQPPLDIFLFNPSTIQPVFANSKFITQNSQFITVGLRSCAATPFQIASGCTSPPAKTNSKLNIQHSQFLTIP